MLSTYTPSCVNPHNNFITRHKSCCIFNGQTSFSRTRWSFNQKTSLHQGRRKKEGKVILKKRVKWEGGFWNKEEEEGVIKREWLLVHLIFLNSTLLLWVVTFVVSLVVQNVSSHSWIHLLMQSKQSPFPQTVGMERVGYYVLFEAGFFHSLIFRVVVLL